MKKISIGIIAGLVFLMGANSTFAQTADMSTMGDFPINEPIINYCLPGYDIWEPDSTLCVQNDLRSDFDSNIPGEYDYIFDLYDSENNFLFGGIYFLVTFPSEPMIGAFFPKVSGTDLLAGVGEVTSPVLADSVPFFVISMGVILAFYLISKLVGIMPRDKKNKIDNKK